MAARTIDNSDYVFNSGYLRIFAKDDVLSTRGISVRYRGSEERSDFVSRRRGSLQRGRGALGNIGPDAKEALPALRQTLNQLRVKGVQSRLRS